MSSSPINSQPIKLPECPICMEHYNLVKKRPYYICRNAHSICRLCYHRHKVINVNFFCPICKCQMNQNHRQNNDIVALLTLHQMYGKGKDELVVQNQRLEEIKISQCDLEFMEKFKIPRIVQIALLLTALCVFPLIFVLISEFSYIIMNTEKAIGVFAYQSALGLIWMVWRLISGFLEGVHSTCEALFIYSIIFHMIYVVHMVLISFSLVFGLKICAEKFVDEQWKMKGRNLKKMELPKNGVEKVCFIVLINFIQLSNKVFQVQDKSQKSI